MSCLCVSKIPIAAKWPSFCQHPRGVEAYSAGSRPSGKINPRAIAAMKELGYDLSTHQSKSLNDLPDVPFDAAVTMGCGDACPNLRAHVREDWQIPDPREMPPEEFRVVRDLIRAKVEGLLRKLSQQQG